MIRWGDFERARGGKAPGLAIGLAVILALSGCAVIDRMSGVADAQDLQVHGESATAKILQIWDTGMTVNDDPVVGFVLEVRPADRPVYEAKTKLRISRLDIARIQPGTVVPVRVDPREPTHVALDIYEYDRVKRSATV
jgi:hypothetical protein